MTEYYYAFKGTFERSVFFQDLGPGLSFNIIYLKYPSSPSVLFYSSVNWKICLNKSRRYNFFYESSYPTVTTAAPLEFTATWTSHWFSQNYVGCIL